MNNLEVATVAAEIEPIFWDAMCVNQDPGFQVGPGVSTRECLEILQLLMREGLGLGQFAFNETLDNAVCGSMFNRHIDTPQAERRAGIAVHEGIAGPEGTVILAPARVGVKNYYIGSSRQIGPSRKGQLNQGMKTVFCEGIEVEGLNLERLYVSGLSEERLVAVRGIVAVRMGPAIHEFTTNDGSTTRQWRRYTYNSQLAPVALDKLLSR